MNKSIYIYIYIYTYICKILSYILKGLVGCKMYDVRFDLTFLGGPVGRKICDVACHL